MRLVILESPFAGNLFQRWANRRYARACVRDALQRGEAPIASHLLYTQPGILRDEVPDERQWGIDAGLAWRAVADASVVYTDRGISKGMKYGIEAARGAGLTVEFRSLRGKPAVVYGRGDFKTVRQPQLAAIKVAILRAESDLAEAKKLIERGC